MEQYLDKKDEKWHITLWFDMPKVIIKNKLNFRIKEVILNDGSRLSDPNFENSKYIFLIHESMLGKKIFFNFSFEPNQISKVSKFIFGLCDERVMWFSEYLIDIENKNFIKETKEKIAVISEDIKVEDDFNKNNLDKYNILLSTNEVISLDSYILEEKNIKEEESIKNEPVVNTIVNSKIQAHNSKKQFGRKSKR